MVLFDTNVFLEILLDQQKADACREALATLDDRHPGWVTSFSLHAIEAILERVGKKNTLERFLQDLSQDTLVLRYETTTEEELDIVRLAPKLSLDFDDALQYFVAKKKRLSLVTLDKDFRGVEGIDVIHPADLKRS